MVRSSKNPKLFDCLLVLLGVRKGPSFLLKLYFIDEENELFGVNLNESLLIEDIANLLCVNILVVSPSQ